MRKLKYLIVALFAFGFSIGAASATTVSTYVSCDKKSVTVGTSVTCHVMAQIGGGSIESFNGNVSISGPGTIASVTKGPNWQGNDGTAINYYSGSTFTGNITVANVVVNTSGAGAVTVKFTPGNQIMDAGSGQAIAARNSGNGNIQVNAVTQAPKPTTKVVTTQAPVQTTAPTTTTTQAPVSLTFTELKVEGFEVKEENGSYYVTVNKDTKTVNIIARVREGVKLTGETGERGLNDGKNTINYVLIDEATNRTQNYQLVITKPTADSVDTSLKSLRIVNYDFKFDPKALEYTVYVPMDTKEVYILAEANTSGVSVKGDGVVTLANGETVATVTVNFGEGNTTKYTIHIKKSLTQLFMWIGIATSIIIAIAVIVYFNLKDQGKIKEGVTSKLFKKAQSNRVAKAHDANAGVKIGGSSVVGFGSQVVTPTAVEAPVEAPVEPKVEETPAPVAAVDTTPVQEAPQPVKTIVTGQPAEVKVVTKTVVPTTVQTVNTAPQQTVVNTTQASDRI